MFHGTPDCPDCGSRFLTFRVPIPAGVVSGPEMRVYRCYRCFSKFTKADVGERTPAPAVVATRAVSPTGTVTRRTPAPSR